MFQARSRSVFGSSKKQDSGGFTQWPMHDGNKIQNKIKLLNSPNRRLDSRDSVLCQNEVLKTKINELSKIIGPPDKKKQRNTIEVSHGDQKS